MDPRVTAGNAGRLIAVVAALLVVLLHGSAARADNVDTLIDQLDDDSDKVRLSATLNLTKLGDQRAILPLIKRLANDSDKNVRVVAASGLGQLVTDKVRGSLRGLAIKALEKAAASDDNDSVRARATSALTSIGGATRSVPPTPGGGVYVQIGPMSSKTGSSSDDAKYRAMMTKVATKTMSRVASNLPTTWPGGGAPTKAELDAKGIQGFFIDGTLNEVKIDKAGSSATVSCKINMLIASFPDKSMFGFLNGGAKVQSSASPREVALAREDCVQAVVEDLIAKKIVPTIKTKAGMP